MFRKLSLAGSIRTRGFRAVLSVLVIMGFLTGFFHSLHEYHGESSDARISSLPELTDKDYGDEGPITRTELVTETEGIDSMVADSFGIYGMVDMNFGVDEQLYQSWESTQQDNTFFPFRTVIQFNITQVPADIDIVKAEMKLYYEQSVDVGGNEGNIDVPVTMGAYPITKSWTQGPGTWDAPDTENHGITWNRRDGINAWTLPGVDYDAGKRSDASTGLAYGWVTWDLTDFVTEWVGGTMDNYGVILITHDRPGMDTLKMFTSMEGQNNRPKLEIEYELPYNEPPLAIIDTIDPNPARELTNITFTGHGEDLEDGTADSGFIWMVKTDYTPFQVLGHQPEITVDNLTAGVYTVRFSVQDSKGDWSPFAIMEDELVVLEDFPPAGIDDLEAIADPSESGAVNLTWTAVAEDKTADEGSASSYMIKYSTNYIDEMTDFENAEALEESDIPDPAAPGATELVILDGLDMGEEYYFAVIAVDARGQMSGLSNIARVIAPDRDAPTFISDLSAEMGELDGTIELMWTAPDDNGGPVDRYEIKYSDTRIMHQWDYFSADLIPNYQDVPLPSAPGTTERVTVTDLEGGEKFYFSMMVWDNWGNAAPLSNNPESLATDRTSPDPITNVMAEDTPNDRGGSLDLQWDRCDADDFEEYRIYMSQKIFTSVKGMNPVKVITTQDDTDMSMTTNEEISIIPRNEYYVAVVALDNWGNYQRTVVPFGPVIPIDNIWKAQAFEDPTQGKLATGERVLSDPMIIIKADLLDVTITRTEISGDEVEVTKTFQIEGTIKSSSSPISHMDIYDWELNEDGEYVWIPFVDQEEAEDLNPNSFNYYSDLYELFTRPSLNRDMSRPGEYVYFWSMDYNITSVFDVDDVPEEGEDETLTLCILGWSELDTWNYIADNYDADITWVRLDEDNDGLPDYWERDKFKNIALYGAEDDPDEDGFSNAMEFEKGTEPMLDRSVPPGLEGDLTKTASSSESEDGFPMFLIIAIIVVIIIGAILIGLIMVIKKSKAKKAEEMIEPASFEPEAQPEELAPAPMVYYTPSYYDNQVPEEEYEPYYDENAQAFMTQPGEEYAGEDSYIDEHAQPSWAGPQTQDEPAVSLPGPGLEGSEEAPKALPPAREEDIAQEEAQAEETDVEEEVAQEEKSVQKKAPAPPAKKPAGKPPAPPKKKPPAPPA